MIALVADFIIKLNKPPPLLLAITIFFIACVYHVNLREKNWKDKVC